MRTTRKIRFFATRRSSGRGQRGVYAIEFAFVFLLFFGLVYMLICYGLVFTFRFGLQNAAEDGARAALRHQSNMTARCFEARRVANLRTANWLPVTPEIDVRIYRSDTAGVANTCVSTCGASWEQRCQVEVTVNAPGMRQVLPPFAGFAMPSSIAGRATVLLDGRAL